MSNDTFRLLNTRKEDTRAVLLFLRFQQLISDSITPAKNQDDVTSNAPAQSSDSEVCQCRRVSPRILARRTND